MAILRTLYFAAVAAGLFATVYGGSGSADLDCKLSGWSSYGECNKTCYGGFKQKTRTVTAEAQDGGKACDELTHVLECNRDVSCDCQLSDWSFSWGECNHTCAGGFKHKTRTVTNHSQDGGKPCDEFELTKAEECNRDVTCPYVHEAPTGEKDTWLNLTQKNGRVYLGAQIPPRGYFVDAAGERFEPTNPDTVVSKDAGWTDAGPHDDKVPILVFDEQDWNNVTENGEGWSARPGVGSFPNILYTQPSQDGQSFITLEATEVTFGKDEARPEVSLPSLVGKTTQLRLRYLKATSCKVPTTTVTELGEGSDLAEMAGCANRAYTMFCAVQIFSADTGYSESFRLCDKTEKLVAQTLY